MAICTHHTSSRGTCVKCEKNLRKLVVTFSSYNVLMHKDFSGWHTLKQKLHDREGIPYFYEGEVWWVNLGLNVGYETDGKGAAYTRPVVVIKKYNEHSFLGIPLSTSKKSNRYYISVGLINNKEAYAILSQLRNLDSRRLVRKIEKINERQLTELKQKISEANLH